MTADWIDRPTVLVSHVSMGPALVDALGDRVSVSLVDSPHALHPQRQQQIQDLDRVDTVIGFHFPDNALAGLPGLRWLHLTGTGIDHLGATGLASDVLVTNSPRVAVEPVAEYAVAGLFAGLKDLMSLGARPNHRRWFGSSSHQLTGSVVAVLGVGRIGRAVIRRLTALGARCLAVTRTGTPVAGAERTIASTDLVRYAGAIEHLVCCLPGTEETRGLVDATVLGALPGHAVVVNVGRASTVDTDALYTALRERRIRAAFLDVHDSEPLPVDDPAWEVPGLIVSPHCGFAFPAEAREVARGFFDNLADLRSGAMPRDRVTLGVST